MREPLFAGVRTPRPPDDLKDRALSAARARAGGAPAPARNGWGFTRFDLALAAALLLLALCNALTSLPGRAAPAVQARPPGTAEGRQLERELGLKDESVIAAAANGRRNGEAERRVMQELERL